MSIPASVGHRFQPLVSVAMARTGTLRLDNDAYLVLQHVKCDPGAYAACQHIHAVAVAVAVQ